MDIWRIPAAGGQAERVTHHNSRVGYPVPLDDRTLLYTATASDGTGPWLYSMDLGTGTSQRVITGVEHYISIAGSAEVAGRPRRLVATVTPYRPDMCRIATRPIPGRVALLAHAVVKSGQSRRRS